MARRPQEVQDVVNRGNLWKEFTGTEWYRDLKSQYDIQLAKSRDFVFDATIRGDDQTAKQEAMKCAGMKIIMDYIENSIDEMKQIIETEKEERAYNNEIRSHV